MDKFTIDGIRYEVNHFNTQTSKNGRPFRLSGVSLVTTKPQVWIDEIKAYRHGTVYSFRYLDALGGFFAFEFDAKDKFVSKLSI